MDAADAARAYEPDPDPPADGERAAHGRGAEQPLRGADPELARPCLPGLAAGLGEALELVFRQTDPDGAVHDADRGRHRARLVYPPLGVECDLQPLTGGKPVRDERRLERDDGSAGVEGLADLGGQLDHGIAPSCATQRAAASSASPTPPIT